MRESFERIARQLEASARDDEQFSASFAGEKSDFVRLNHNRYRQPGTVTQLSLSLQWRHGRRHATGDLALSGDTHEDAQRVDKLVRNLREMVPLLPEDPLLLVPTERQDTSLELPGELPDAGDAVDALLNAARDNGKDPDLVGLYAGGDVWRAFADHNGQRNWFATKSFTLDFSLVHSADKAVKTTIAGARFDAAEVARKAAVARERLALLARPSKKLSPGKYRAWFTPAAMEEIFGLLSWDLGLRAVKTRQSALTRLAEGVVRFDPRITLDEDVAGGVAANFTADGFVRPARTSLIEGGRYAGSLVSPRSALEFGVAHTGADAGESPGALWLRGGDLAEADVLKALGTGVYVGNLWYLNWSDRQSARATGMTRFATFWVEDGEIVAPIDVMRFDDTLFGLFGDRLEALGAEPEMRLSTETYSGRSTSSSRLPGALVRDFAFTL
jgi:predicted Zn-dependent protease